jgi:hypothetical protein
VAEKPKLKFKGKEYDIAPLDSWSLDEALVLYEYAKLTLDQVDDDMGFHPGLVGALIHVSVKRAYPKTPEKTLRADIGALKMSELNQVFEGISEEVEEEDPPAQPPSGGDSSNANVTPLPTNDNGDGFAKSSEEHQAHSQPGFSGDRSSDTVASA